MLVLAAWQHDVARGRDLKLVGVGARWHLLLKIVVARSAKMQLQGVKVKDGSIVAKGC